MAVRRVAHKFKCAKFICLERAAHLLMIIARYPVDGY